MLISSFEGIRRTSTSGLEEMVMYVITEKTPIRYITYWGFLLLIATSK